MGAMGRQAKLLTDQQVKDLLAWLGTRRHAERNSLIVLLSLKARLRAGEIACLKWAMVMDASGNIGKTIHLTNAASKGKKGGRKIPLNKEVRRALLQLKDSNSINIDDAKKFVIQTQRQEIISAQFIMNMFGEWFKKLGFVGLQATADKETIITTAREDLVGRGKPSGCSRVGGHSNLTTTSR